MQTTALFNKKAARKHSNKRQTVQLSGWGSPALKAEMERIAKSEGISLSQIIVSACEELVAVRLQRRREILEKPILEAFFDKKMNRVINRLSEFLGRSVFETGQMRWLFVNTLYHDVIRQVATEKNPEKKDALRQAFYKLLDASQKETVKAVKQWNPNMIDVVAAIKQRLKEETI